MGEEGRSCEAQRTHTPEQIVKEAQGDRQAALEGRVGAAIDLSVSWRVSPAFPSLDKMFVATLLGLEDCMADVFSAHPHGGPYDSARA